jgi:adenine-specific DNA-methyltransferase
MVQEYKIEELLKDDETIENILIKGDNLLALNALKKLLSNKPELQKPKCVFIDPPYNTGKAFLNYDDNLEISSWLTLMRVRIVIIHEILREDGYIFIILDDNATFHYPIYLETDVDQFLQKIAENKRHSYSSDGKRISLIFGDFGKRMVFFCGNCH